MAAPNPLSFLRFTTLAAACVFAATAVGADEPVAETETSINQDTQQTVTNSVTIGRSTNVESKLSAEFSEFLGGEEAAADVVGGLRTGQGFSLSGGTDGESGEGGSTSVPPVTGVDGSPPTPVELPTGTMGYGNVRISLKLAEARLAQMGITRPTSEELSAILLGGEIGGVAVDGILSERAAGAGWGEIAHRYDLKVGQLMGKGKAGVEVVQSQDAELVADEPPVEAVDPPADAQQAAVSEVPAMGNKKAVVAAGPAKASGGKSHGQQAVNSARLSNGYIPSRGASVSAASYSGKGYSGHKKTIGAGRSNGYIPSGQAGGQGAGIVTAAGTHVAIAAGKSASANGHIKAGMPKAVHAQGGGIVSASNSSASASVASAAGRGLAKGHAKGKN